MKKLALVIALLCFVLTGIFALEAAVVWNWYRNDRGVKYYRYQLDGEEEDNWTVVDSNVYEVSLDIDVSVVHVLYLQQSYDGIHWSESSCTESEVYEDSGYSDDEDFYYDEFEDFPEDEEVVEESVTTTEEAEEVVVAEASTPKVKKDSRTFLDVAFSYRNSIPNRQTRDVGLVLTLSHVFPFEQSFTSGFRVENAYYTTTKIADGLTETDYFITLSALGVMNFAPSRGDFTIGFGPEAQLKLNSTEDPTLYWGLNSLLGMRFKITDNISLSFSASDHFYFYPEKINTYDVRFGVSMRL